MSVGKTKEAWLEAALNEYAKRLSALVQFEYVFFKEESLLEKALLKEGHVVLLDALGHHMDSLEFADWLFSEIEKADSRLTFVIGGPEGLSAKVKEHYSKISLSRMTYTHQMARLILLEQIFRAFEIKKGSHYHK